MSTAIVINIQNKSGTMIVRQPRYSKEEFTQRGDEIYKSQVRPQVEEGNVRRFGGRTKRAE
jgi:hypothetical protein